MIDYQEIAQRYVSVWNETDAARRRDAIAELWTNEGANFVGTLEFHGQAELETRVTSAHEKWIAEAGNRFQLRQPAQGHHGGVFIWWEMVTRAGGDVAGTGLEFLVLDSTGRIEVDYQFADPFSQQ